MTPEVVELGKGISEDDLLFHDEKSIEPSLAFLLSRLRQPDFPEAIGVFRDVATPVYDEGVNQQVDQAQKANPDATLDELFNSGTSWDVE
jgi:2-oxoglutarate ferredoxin oxidoreductase subunit beta